MSKKAILLAMLVFLTGCAVKRKCWIGHYTGDLYCAKGERIWVEKENKSYRPPVSAPLDYQIWRNDSRRGFNYLECLPGGSWAEWMDVGGIDGEHLEVKKQQ